MDLDLISTTQQAPIPAKTHLLALIKKAIPLSFLFGSEIGSNFIKAYLMAGVGTDELTALMIATNISYLVIYPFPEFVGQDVVFIAEHFGKIKQMRSQNQQEIPEDGMEANNHMIIGSLVRQGWTLSALVSLPAAAILLSSPYFLLRLFNQTDEVNHLATQFNYPVAISLFAEFTNKISEGLISAVDKEKWLFPYRALSLSVEIGLSFALIPRYSVAGAGYASLGKSLFGFIYLMIFFKVHADFHQKFNIFDRNISDVNNLYKILHQSWPRFVTKMAGSFSTVGVTILIGQLPKDRIVLDGIVGHFYGLLFALNFGVSEAANRIVAQYYGAQSYEEMRRAGNFSLALNACMLGANAIVYNSIPLVLASQFLNKNEVHEYANLLRWYFFLIGLANFLNVLSDNGSRNLAATQDTFLASVSSLSSTVALILPLTAIVVYCTNFDLYGVGSAIVLGTLPATLCTLGYWNQHSKAIIDTPDAQVPTSNTRAELRLKSFFWEKRRMISTSDREAYRLLELPSSSEPSPERVIEDASEHTLNY